MYQYDSIFRNLRSKEGFNAQVWEKTYEGALFFGRPWYLLEQQLRPIFYESKEIPKIPKTLKVSKELPTPVEKIKTTGREDFKKNPLILFITDYPRNNEELFSEEQKSLFENIVGAMRLSRSEFACFSALPSFLTEEENDWSLLVSKWRPQLENLILKHKPQLVIPLGAMATNLVLGTKERLSIVHGQFFERTLFQHSYQVVPIFHMDFLLINPNMKKAAWADLQKVMKMIGKID